MQLELERLYWIRKIDIGIIDKYTVCCSIFFCMILQNKLMNEKFNSLNKSIKVYICPSIHKCCFEVDEDVMNLFSKKFSNLKNIIYEGNVVNGLKKYYIDTVEISRQLLLNIGFKDENIFLSEFCTKCNSDIFNSYRKDKEKSGRNIALIVLNRIL